MATTVIIPALNEALTIRKIVEVFQQHPATRGNVRVAIDARTCDDTLDQVLEGEGIPLQFSATTGKGEIVRGAVDFLSAAGRLTSRIILCDGDYTGLTPDHIDQLIAHDYGMIIGVPDWPENVPDHVINSWPHVSGFRFLPRGLIPPNAHGYLLETQLNRAAVMDRCPIGHVLLTGLKSPFQWPLAEARMEALERDREWGMAHGIL